MPFFIIQNTASTQIKIKQENITNLFLDFYIVQYYFIILIYTIINYTYLLRTSQLGSTIDAKGA